MTPLIEESEQIPIIVWSKLIQRLDSTMSMISLFSSSNAKKFITHTLLHLEMIIKS